MAESRFRELERWARLRIQAMIDLTRVPSGGTVGQVVTKTATGYDWATPAGGALTDGDKGDITVSGGGAAWAIDADAVTYAKMQNVTAASRLLGRGSAGGAGDPQELTVSTGLSLSGTALSAGTLDTIPAPVASVGFNGQQATTFRIENRTDDTGCTEVGRLWLRTDL